MWRACCLIYQNFYHPSDTFCHMLTSICPDLSDAGTASITISLICMWASCKNSVDREQSVSYWSLHHVANYGRKKGSDRLCIHTMHGMCSHMNISTFWCKKCWQEKDLLISEILSVGQMFWPDRIWPKHIRSFMRFFRPVDGFSS